MRMAVQVALAALIGVFGGFWITLLVRPEHAKAIIVATVDHLPPYVTELGRTAFGQQPPTLREAWADVLRVRPEENSARVVQYALAGYERAALRELRSKANNPASFELVSARWAKDKVLCITFRATNGFNALMLGRALATGKTVYSDSVIDRDFDREWDRVCGRTAADARAIEKSHRDIAVLRAERAHLARPERIEEMARKVGLPPR